MKVLDYDGLEYYNGLVEDKYAPKYSPALTGTPTAPTPTAGDDSTKIATTEYVQAELEDYLALSGGTMTGAITTSAVDFIKRDVNNGHLAIMGGTEYSNSASVRLAGGDETGQTGLFQLRAQDGTSHKDLLGKPDGTLTWGGTAVAVGSFLPLSGGVLTGNVTMDKSAPHVDLKDTVIARNIAPSANYAQVEINGKDKNNANTWGLYHRYWTTKQHEISLLCYKGTTTDNTYVGIGAGYDSSGNAYTIAPTPATSDNSTKIATTAYVKSNISSYLPLAGGTMTGSIASSASDLTIYKTILTGRTVIRGGNDYNNCSSLYLAGKSHSDNAQFQILCNNGTNNAALIGKPNGTLTWAGKNVETVDTSSFANDTGWIRYKNGLQIVWARISITGTSKAFTFAKSFNQTPVVTGSPSERVSISISGVSTTGFNCYHNGSNASNSMYVRYIAIGKWE